MSDEGAGDWLRPFGYIEPPFADRQARGGDALGAASVVLHRHLTPHDSTFDPHADITRS